MHRLSIRLNWAKKQYYFKSKKGFYFTFLRCLLYKIKMFKRDDNRVDFFTPEYGAGRKLSGCEANLS